MKVSEETKLCNKLQAKATKALKGLKHVEVRQFCNLDLFGDLSLSKTMVEVTITTKSLQEVGWLDCWPRGKDKTTEQKKAAITAYKEKRLKVSTELMAIAKKRLNRAAIPFRAGVSDGLMICRLK